MKQQACVRIVQKKYSKAEGVSAVYIFPTGKAASDLELSQMLANTESDNTLNGNHLHSEIVSKFTDDIQGHFQSTRERAEGFVKDHPYVAAALEQYEGREKTPTSTLATAPESTERVLLTRRELPEKAPALWAEAKQPGDTPPIFIQRHYAPWLGKGFTQADLRHLDPQCEMALRNWRRKNQDPEWFNLPTKHESLAQRYSTPPSSDTVEGLRAAWRERSRYQRARDR